MESLLRSSFVRFEALFSISRFDFLAVGARIRTMTERGQFLIATIPPAPQTPPNWLDPPPHQIGHFLTQMWVNFHQIGRQCPSPTHLSPFKMLMTMVITIAMIAKNVDVDDVEQDIMIRPRADCSVTKLYLLGANFD